MIKTLRLLVGLALVLVCVPVSSGVVSPLKIGIAPNGGDSVSLARLWIPFLEKLEADSGVELNFVTAPDLLAFNQRLSDGEYDLVVTDQYLYTIFSKKHQLAYMAELSGGQARTKMALVAAPDIKKVDQLNGTLLAVKDGEKPGNVQSLNDFLTAKGIRALRDSLTSYDKILASIQQQLHVAGLVPLSKARQAQPPLNILWHADNKHSYVLTSPSSTPKATLAKLLTALQELQPLADEKADDVVSVISVRQGNKALESE